MFETEVKTKDSAPPESPLQKLLVLKQGEPIMVRSRRNPTVSITGKVYGPLLFPKMYIEIESESIEGRPGWCNVPDAGELLTQCFHITRHGNLLRDSDDELFVVVAQSGAALERVK